MERRQAMAKKIKPKSISEWYNELPTHKKVWARDLIMLETGAKRSTFFKVVKGEFNPKPENRQKICNVAGIPLQFAKETYYPVQEPANNAIGQQITEPK